MPVPLNRIEPQAVPVLLLAHSAPFAATFGVRWNVLPTRVNGLLPLKRVMVTAPPIEADDVKVHELVLDWPPEVPPILSKWMTGLLTGLLKVTVNVCATLFIWKRNEGPLLTAPPV